MYGSDFKHGISFFLELLPQGFSENMIFEHGCSRHGHITTESWNLTLFIGFHSCREFRMNLYLIGDLTNCLLFFRQCLVLGSKNEETDVELLVLSHQAFSSYAPADNICRQSWCDEWHMWFVVVLLFFFFFYKKKKDPEEKTLITTQHLR